MKVIEPLFLDELYAELENIEDNIDQKLKPSRLRKLHKRIAEIKIFDPACGSGNFLIIAFKELRKLEMEIIKRLYEIEQNDGQDDLFDEVGLDSSFSRIKLTQFYGIEFDDFAHEVAILSLWLAEHQMNVEFKAEFGECKPTLPLQNGGKITCDNALRVDWKHICSFSNNEEVFILGNPPYLGSKVQKAHHKSDMKVVFQGLKNFKDLDYIACWFYKASLYISNKYQKYAFVTTNSICQGGQVAMLWSKIFPMNLEIFFCYQPFKWSNHAKNNAGVTVTIIGIRTIDNQPKKYYSNDLVSKVDSINGYLTQGGDSVIGRRAKPISNLPRMDLGNMPIDGGNLILSTTEKDALVSQYPQASKLVKKLYGSNEFIKGTIRWCLWITDDDLELANSVPSIKERINNVYEKRASSTDKGTQKLASRPHQFREMKHANNNLLIVCRVSSERRLYIPMGILDKDCIIADAQVIYDPEPHIFGLLTSRMHMVWVKATSGCLESRIRYSSAISYNNFPVPELNEQQKSEISHLSLNILIARESHPELTIAALYDVQKTPPELVNAHNQLDRYVEQCYRQEYFHSDDDRLEHLFNLYEQMTGGQNA